MKKFNSKIIFFLIIIFLVVNVLDYITALFVESGESNPIYLWTGSFFLVLLFKLFVVFMMFVIYFRNRYETRFWFFNYIYILCIGIFLVSFGVYSNILGILNNNIVQEAGKLTIQEKTHYYFGLITWLFLIPYIISLISFKIYDVCEKKIRY